MATLRIAVFDRRRQTLDGITDAIRRRKGVHVVGAETSPSRFLQVLKTTDPQIAILSLHRQSDIQFVKRARVAAPDARLIVVVEYLSTACVVSVLRLGARAVLPADVAPALMARCLDVASTGGLWLERRLASDVVRRLLKTALPGTESLTPREQMITGMVGDGLRNKEIANRLGISEGTVKVHLHSIFHKLGIQSRVALAALVRPAGERA